MRTGLILLSGGCLLLAAALLNCGESTNASAWTTVKTWSGEGTKERETFSVRSREWRINWKTSGEKFEGAGIFQIYVHSEDGALVSLAANKQGVGEDTSYVRSAGRHYLKINSANVHWRVEVQDQR